MKCYFCGVEKRLSPTLRRLYDGREEIQCGHCKKAMDEDLKVAKERGLYDPLRLSVSQKPTTSSGEVGNGRYKNMKIEKGVTGGSNLKAVFVEKRKIPNVKILDEGEYVTYKAKKEGEKDSTKLVVGVSYEGQGNDDPDRWSMNNKSMNSLIEKWGDDTAVWVGKTAEINLSGDGEYRHIVVDEIRTK